MNGKALPPRPGTRDGPYSNPQGQFGGPLGQQNGYQPYNSPRQANTSPTKMRNMENYSPQSPNGAVILEGYRNDIMNGFQGEKARYNPMNPTRPQSSILLNVNDPIQVHLLVETALGDSSEFEILSQEEVDDLKKQCQSLTQRIEQTRQNLAIQSKYRDAAVSMAKLYNPDKKEGKRRSGILHHKSDSVKEADIERLRSEEKCEELAAELWSLEKRLMVPQLRLLKHTAGILQMTHKGPKKTAKGPGAQQGGIPGSPESMYTYHNARSSMEQVSEENFFDERSLYRSADRLDVYGEFGGRDSTSGPPSKSQAREQMQMISKTERKLQNLNSRLREVIIKANPQQEQTFSQPPLASTNGQGKSLEAGEMLQSHLDYLEKSISTIDEEQNQLLQRQNEADAAMEETIEDMNREVRGVLVQYDPNRPEPPEVNGTSLNDQLIYFRDSVNAIQDELAHAGDSKGFQDNVEQMEAVLMGLWDIIQSGYEDIKRRKQERRMTRSQNGLPDDEDDMSDDEANDPNEPFSIQAFSAKVQWLYAQSTQLKDQKKVLQRQIKQQRELNSKSDATKDAEIMQKVQELERIKALLTRTEQDSDTVREQLSSVMEKLDEARQQERLRDQERAGSESAAVRAAQEELDQRNQAISRLEEELQELKDDHSIAGAEIQGKLSEAEAKIATVTAELTAAVASKTTAEALLKEKEADVEAKEKEMEGMNHDLARLQTEVTIARAELDGAYGTRAQRAAEVAANPVIQREIDDLNKKNSSLIAEIAALRESSASAGQGSKESDEKLHTLKKELEETIEEYEVMTKASIEWEKEREKLEETIDKLRDEREGLEAQLSDEKVRWLGMQSPGGEPSPGAGNTSTTVLKNEFKKMMRDTRAENAKALRAEQAERRRIEDELRALKKLQGPGKSSLSQSM